MPERAAKSNRISAYILFFVIAVAPLPVGSRDPTTVAMWCFVLALGLIFAAPRGLRGGHLALLAGVGLIVACFGFVLHEQLSAHPWVAAPHPIWARTAELLGRPVQPSVSIVRGEPFYALGPSLAALLALVLGMVIGVDNDRAQRALLVLGLSGVGYAAYGIAHIFNGEFLTATFVNRNTAAAYFGSCAVVWSVLFMSTLRGHLPAGPIIWVKALPHLLSESSKKNSLILRLALLFVCLTAMFLTGSRAGVLLSLFVITIAFAIFFRRDLPRGVRFLLVLIGAGAVVLVLFQLFGGQVEARITSGGLADQGRLAAYRSTLKIIADNPWFGTGLGTFASSLPPYRSGDISIRGVWDIAHSTPLELAAEAGVPIACLVLLAWLTVFLVLFRGTRLSRRVTIVPIAALVVALIAHLHSLIDFSLQVPGYTIVVFAIVGVGLGQSFQTVLGTQSEVPSHGHRRRKRRGKVRDGELRSSKIRAAKTPIDGERA